MLMPCAAPPAPLKATVLEATRFASHYVRPIAVPEVCMADMEPQTAGLATRGVVWFAAGAADEYARPLVGWPRWNMGVVLHEVLHQYGWQVTDFSDPKVLDFEEGLVSAVVVDLFPRWSRHLVGWRIDTVVPYRYRQSARQVRRVARTMKARIRLLASSYRGQP